MNLRSFICIGINVRWQMNFPDQPEHYFENAYGKTHYRYIQVESAQIAVLLPGFSIPSSAYATFAQNLSETGFSVLTIDYFGRGFSIPSKYFECTLSSYVQQVLDLLEYLKIEKCVMISFSFGSIIACNIASILPSIISRLVFISPFHFLQKTIRPFQKFLLSNFLFGSYLLKIAAPQILPTDIASHFSDLTQHNEAYKGTLSCCLHQLNYNPSYCETLSKFIGNFDEQSVIDEITKVTQMSVRALVLLGENDILIDIKESEIWWKHWMPNVKVIVRENVGHLMFLEEPDDTSELVARFLHR
ncbi:Clan SC, family S33, methylesterase-like serine peptidase [Tritrichomonas foetus]|uniref:Clan SC, family S33, methylesterase-like serine peptidase n=1 Tax=Tritrichomonas foetus TaxID=1144522 RepID=A0A1J4KYH6_9EUKA|nr:Clan SC, family S33, methylesterase-like serine peptidase [Tritrichomonas foetus]|eukprot:OHT14613.1 Clan SC, family S33, methylesterase-like serine peptidase [Tritrichomonas foetus]